MMLALLRHRGHLPLIFGAPIYLLIVCFDFWRDETVVGKFTLEKNPRAFWAVLSCEFAVALGLLWGAYVEGWN